MLASCLKRRGRLEFYHAELERMFGGRTQAGSHEQCMGVPGPCVPVAALFENLNDGAKAQEFVEWFPSVTLDQVHCVLMFAQEVWRRLEDSL